ncbi:uncharacterized protein DNG_05035 [Cephalotrichum gorgonifer]|uniref:Uncharacterized protein n=1 Tax=Cephalotrichum gorgonifer TaxID=2041049 RepID=A0AAE8MXL3_9PEZI|nr:uncharacterized protein DNG_05035 [Cephalotrichum gorgonifer]
MAITHFPGTRTPYGQESGTRLNALILGYDKDDISRFKTVLQARKRFIFEPRAAVMAFLEVEKHKRFREVRQGRSGLPTGSSTDTIGEGIPSPPNRRRDVDDNVKFYISVAMLKANALQPWKQQLLSLRSQVGDGDPQLSFELHQLALQYEHRMSRCDVILQGASLIYQLVRIPIPR